MFCNALQVEATMCIHDSIMGSSNSQVSSISSTIISSASTSSSTSVSCSASCSLSVSSSLSPSCTSSFSSSSSCSSSSSSSVASPSHCHASPKILSLWRYTILNNLNIPKRSLSNWASILKLLGSIPLQTSNDGQ